MPVVLILTTLARIGPRAVTSNIARTISIARTAASVRGALAPLLALYSLAGKQ